MSMNFEEFKECLKKRVDSFPQKYLPDWVEATLLLSQVELLRTLGHDVGVSEDQLWVLAQVATPPWLGLVDPVKIAEMIIEHVGMVLGGNDYDACTFAYAIITNHANAVIPLLSDDDLVGRLRRAMDDLFYTIAYEC